MHTVQQPMEKDGQRLSTFLLCVSVIFTLLTYSRFEGVAHYSKIIMPVLWILCLSVRIIECGFTFHISKEFSLMVCVFLIYFLKCKLFYFFGIYSTEGLGPANNLYLCLLYYYIGYSTENIEYTFKRLLFVYVIVTLVLGMEAAITSFSANYIYEESNEAHLSVLVAVCVLILLFFVKYRSILIRIAMSGIAIIMLVSMIIMHTRTPAIAVLICAVYLLLISKKSYKGLLLFVIVTIVLLIIGIKTGFLNSLIEELFPAHMSDHRITGMDSLDVFLSGRVTLYEICWRDFLSSPIIGVGNWDYVDSFPLYVLATGGFFSAVLLLPIAYGIPLRGVFKREKIMLSEINDDYYCKLFTFAKVIAVFYTIVSITEASPPLGTGTMVFVPWIVYGMRKRVEDDGSFKNDE